mmetsp:Transcript_14304/g.30047  ORF Transcript_14304/g.30047 Transcript_14304/m.30047 type:complete len:95 (-) Transcript_14304:1241-1525(-)
MKTCQETSTANRFDECAYTIIPPIMSTIPLDDFTTSEIIPIQHTCNLIFACMLCSFNHPWRVQPPFCEYVWKNNRLTFHSTSFIILGELKLRLH